MLKRKSRLQRARKSLKKGRLFNRQATPKRIVKALGELLGPNR